MNIVKQKRIEKGISVGRMAKELKISKARYLYYERYASDMPISKANSLCKILNINLIQLP